MSSGAAVEIRRQIAELARLHLGWTEPLPFEARLLEDLGLDSLQRMILAIEVENHFQLCLEPEDEAAIVTVDDLARTVERKLGRTEREG